MNKFVTVATTAAKFTTTGTALTNYGAGYAFTGLFQGSFQGGKAGWKSKASLPKDSSQAAEIAFGIPMAATGTVLGGGIGLAKGTLYGARQGWEKSTKFNKKLNSWENSFGYNANFKPVAAITRQSLDGFANVEYLGTMESEVGPWVTVHRLPCTAKDLEKTLKENSEILRTVDTEQKETEQFLTELERQNFVNDFNAKSKPSKSLTAAVCALFVQSSAISTPV